MTAWIAAMILSIEQWFGSKSNCNLQQIGVLSRILAEAES